MTPDHSRESRSIDLTYDQRCALLWVIEEMLVIDDPESVPEDWDRENVGILLRQTRSALRLVNSEPRERSDLEWAAHELLAATRRWLLETGPGLHVNTAVGRTATKRGVERLEAVLADLGQGGQP